MKGLILHDFLHTVGGAERVLECISRLVEPDFDLLAVGFDQEILEQLNLKQVKALLPFNINESQKRRIAPGIQYLVSKLSFEIPVITSSYSFVHLVQSPAQLTYCHSPMRQIWSGYTEYSNSKSLIQNTALKILSKRMQVLDRTGAIRRPNFIASSQVVAARIQEYYGFEPLAVVSPPVSDELFTFEIKDDKDYWVWCGRIIEPYKKVGALVEIFNSLNERLVVIGDGPDRARIESKANSNISFVGFKGAREFSELISGAKGLIYPSHEDFGMMPMESLALGTPVIVSNLSGVFKLLESNPYCIGIDNLDQKSLVQAMHQLLKFSYSRQSIRDSVVAHTENHFANSFKQIWRDVASSGK